MNKTASKKTTKGKAGRKASGLRDLSPDAARLVVCAGAEQVVAAAVRLDREINQKTAHAGPTLLRLLRQDVEVTQMMVPDEARDGEMTMQAVVRATGDQLVRRMQLVGFSPELRRTAVNFAADVEKVSVGSRLTANLSGVGGASGSTDHAGDQLVRMERLAQAQALMNLKERSAVWAYVVFGLPLSDIGWMVGGARVRTASLGDVAYLFVEGGLERMQRWYMARGNPASQGLEVGD
jgi:hypothetical protein